MDFRALWLKRRKGVPFMGLSKFEVYSFTHSKYSKGDPKFIFKAWWLGITKSFRVIENAAGG